MKWIVEAESIDDIVLGNYSINDMPLTECKDCIYWDTTWTNDFSPDHHYCPMVDGVRKKDWFCADAERRTDDGE